MGDSGLTLGGVIKSAMERYLGESVHTCVPGQIEKYDHTKQEADVKPCLWQKFDDGASPVEMPVCTNVPVIFPRTAAGSIVLPVSAGDYVLLVFCEKDIGGWLLQGGVVNQDSLRTFDITDAVAIPGLWPFNVQGPAPNGDDLQIKRGDSVVTIKKNGDIEIGKDTFKKLVNEAFKEKFDNHVHFVSVSGGPAAQLGVSSSPAVVAGIHGPLKVGAVPGTTYTQADVLEDSELTSKVSAE